MTVSRAGTTPSSSLIPFPKNLTHCCECGAPFPGPMDEWDDYFAEIEDASFLCTECADEFDGTAANAR